MKSVSNFEPALSLHTQLATTKTYIGPPSIVHEHCRHTFALASLSVLQGCGGMVCTSSNA